MTKLILLNAWPCVSKDIVDHSNDKGFLTNIVPGTEEMLSSQIGESLVVEIPSNP